MNPATAHGVLAPLTQAALMAQQVTLRRHGQTVLQDIDLSLPQGAVLGLVGRNGAGKTSLLRCMVGLSLPDSGRCELLGEAAADLSDGARARLGYVAQSPDLFDGLSAEQHFRRLAPLYPRWQHRYAVELSVRLQLPLGTPARRLSLGDQQKLSVVLALAHDPDLLILDEPVASLDPITRRDFMRSLFERRADERPRSVLISSHLLADLERVVSHVAFIRGGRLQLCDEWDALAEHLRLLVGTAHSLPVHTGPGIVHRQQRHGELRLLVDSRLQPELAALGEPMNLDDMFTELNP